MRIHVSRTVENKAKNENKWCYIKMSLIRLRAFIHWFPALQRARRLLPAAGTRRSCSVAVFLRS